MNPYSYSVDNPVKYIDPQGEWFKDFMTGQQSWPDFQMELGQAARYTGPLFQTVMDHPYISGGIIGVGSGITAMSTVALLGSSFTCGILCGSTTTTLSTTGGTLVASQGDKIQKAVNGLKIGQSFGKLGTVIENSPGKITGIFTRANGEEHALMRVLTRSASIQDISKTVRSPLATLQQAGGNVLYLTKQAGVVLNKAGEIMTVYGAKEFNSTINNLLSNFK